MTEKSWRKKYLDFGDEFLKSIKNNFPPGPGLRNAIFPKNGGKKISKNPKKSPHSYPPWGPYCIFDSFIALCFITIICSICILYSLWFFISTTTIWFVKTWNATEVLRSFLYIGRFPLNSFSFSLRIFFSVFIPIAFITTIPSEVFLGLSQLWKILIEVLVALIFLSTSRKFWLFALKFYSSASS